MCSSVQHIYMIWIFHSDTYFHTKRGIYVPKMGLPARLKAKLEKQGYSEEMIEELWKWYDPSVKKGVASY
jgi:hypothetical protein